MRIKIPFTSRYLEIRSFLANPASWLYEALAGGKSISGVSVNETTAMQCSAVFSCVRVLAETIASLPLPVYRRLSGGGKERAADHYLYIVLHDQPNPEMTSFELRETLMGHLCLWGNAYCEIVRDGAGQVSELWPLRPDRMVVKRNQDGRLLYQYMLPAGGQAVLTQSQIFHLRGLGGDGVIGYSPIRMAREAIGLALATEEFGARFFGEGTHPGGIMEHPGKLSEQAHQNLKASLTDAYSGLGKSHRLMILEEGMKFTQIGIPPEDSQYLEVRKFQIAEIARIFRVPLHLVNETDKAATYASVEQFALQFVVHTIRPWLVRWEQAIKKDLFLPDEQNTYFAEFLVDGLLRGDIESRYRAYATGRQWGWLSANDVREKENMNPVDGGNIYMVPLNMVPADMVSADKGDQAPSDASRVPERLMEIRAEVTAESRRRMAGRYRRLFKEAGERIVRREVKDLRQAIEKHLKKRDELSLNLWLEKYYRDEHPEFIEQQMLPVLQNYAEEIRENVAGELARELDAVPALDDYTRAYLLTFITRYAISSQRQISQILREAAGKSEDPLPVLDERLNEWVEKRPGKIATRESNQANNAFALFAYAGSGITKKRWVASGKSCPYCQSLNGKVIGINSSFIHKDEEFKPDGAEVPLTPRSNIGNPPAHAGCDCFIASSM